MKNQINSNVKFVNEYLENIKWSNEEDWQVEGILKRISNEHLKFDIRFLRDFDDKKGKLINEKSRAHKVLFENDKKWILIETFELINYMKIKKIKIINLENLMQHTDWNIILPKKNV
jgi:hypothetical protein